MKRIIAAVMILTLALGLAACGSKTAGEDTTTATPEESTTDLVTEESESVTEEAETSKADESVEAPDESTEPAEETGKEEDGLSVPKPLTRAEIEALPIASEGMTEDEMRKLCVDFYVLQGSFQWTPNETFMCIYSSTTN